MFCLTPNFFIQLYTVCFSKDYKYAPVNGSLYEDILVHMSMWRYLGLILKLYCIYIYVYILNYTVYEVYLTGGAPLGAVSHRFNLIYIYTHIEKERQKCWHK